MKLDLLGGEASKKEPPRILYYNEDFVDLYDKCWIWIRDYFGKWTDDAVFNRPLFSHPSQTVLSQEEALYCSFFLVYSNGLYPAHNNLDFFYAMQESDGAIRSHYDLKTGQSVQHPNNPAGLGPPLFPWAEYNLYHKVGSKKRLKDVLPILRKYLDWIDANFRDENGLYRVPFLAGGMTNGPRAKAAYPIDFNAQMAISYLYLSVIGDLLNEKETAFMYKKLYYFLKTRINSLMWSDETGFYHDLDAEGKILPTKSLAAYWTLLAEIVSEARAEVMISHLKNENLFGAPNPFPSLSMDDPHFSKHGEGYMGSVFPHLTFMVIKGLEKYSQYELAREATSQHLFYILDTFHPDHKQKGYLWNAYLPTREGPARWSSPDSQLLQQHLAYACLATITLMIENIVGLLISLPKKTVDWIVPTIELMGIENLSLKRNFIGIVVAKSNRGWEIRLESEKLYYFTVNLIGVKKKTLPIPSGKCSLLIDKI